MSSEAPHELVADNQEAANSSAAESGRENEHKRTFKVKVLYNGLEKQIEVRLEETVKRLLDHAIQIFGITNAPHTLSLFKDGVELVDTQTIREAGLKPDDTLLLRPGAVKAG